MKIILASLLALTFFSSSVMAQSALDRAVPNRTQNQTQAQQPSPQPAVQPQTPRVPAPVQQQPQLAPTVPAVTTTATPVQGPPIGSGTTLSADQTRALFAQCLQKMGVTAIRTLSESEINALSQCMTR